MSELSSVKKVAVQKAMGSTLLCLREFRHYVSGSKASQIVILGGLASTLFYLLLRKRHHLPPGPFALPLLGNVFAFRKKEPLYVTLHRWARESYGPLITLQLGPVTCITLNRLDVVLEALVEKSGDFSGRVQLCSLGIQTGGFQDIIFANDSAAWRPRRKAAAEAVRRCMEREEEMDVIVHHVVKIVADEMVKEKNAFNPLPYISVLVFHLLDTLCFGKKKDVEDPSIQRIASIFHKISEEAGKGFLEDLLPFLQHVPSRRFQKFGELTGQFLDYVYTQFQEHRDSFSPDRVPRDFVDCLLKAKNEVETEEEEEEEGEEGKGEKEVGGMLITPSHVCQIISDVFGGGVETLSHTLHWGLLFMASHPQEQARVQAEIDDVTGSRWPSSRDLPHLVYTEATLHEILRLGTPAPVGIAHRTLRHTTLRGHDIPVHSVILVNHWAILRDPDHWEFPEEFRPGRFVDGSGRLKRGVESWLPFSAGGRACAGQGLATRCLLLAVACLLKRFEVTLGSGVEFDASPLCENLTAHVPKPHAVVVRER